MKVSGVPSSMGNTAPGNERLPLAGELCPTSLVVRLVAVVRTREELGEAAWVVTALDRERHAVEYYRIEPGRYVARVRVGRQAKEPERTQVAGAYTFVGLSDAGNRDIAAMSEAAYELTTADPMRCGRSRRRKSVGVHGADTIQQLLNAGLLAVVSCRGEVRSRQALFAVECDSREPSKHARARSTCREPWRRAGGSERAGRRAGARAGAGRWPPWRR
jgi:hypothetical protein